ncbi:MAG: DUF423 domain-containing protein [Pseudomonadota bacterium]
MRRVQDARCTGNSLISGLADLRISRPIMLSGILLATTGVILGAWGAHGLETVIGEGASGLATWETAVDYQFIHALGLLVIAVWHGILPDHLLPRAALLMCLGVVFFSGSLYALVLGAPGWLGPVTPVGGLLLISGWLVAGIAALRASTDTR